MFFKMVIVCCSISSAAVWGYVDRLEDKATERREQRQYCEWYFKCPASAYLDLGEGGYCQCVVPGDWDFRSMDTY